MKITQIDSTYIPVWVWNNIDGHRHKYIHEWVTPEESERIWFEAQMLKRYGSRWDEDD